MTKVIFLQDYHGVKESVYRQLDILQELPLKREKSIILHEALSDDNDSTVRQFTSSGRYFLNQMWEELDLESHWGPSESYKDFFQQAKDMRFWTGALDHTTNERMQLAYDFLEFVKNYKGRDSDNLDLIKLKRRVGAERDLGFCNRIDSQLAPYRPETIIVVTHPTHITPCAYYLQAQGYKIEITPIDEGLKENLGKKEDEIQLKRFSEMDLQLIPPLVPIVTYAWDYPSKVAQKTQ